MPNYAYSCKDCQHSFEKILSLAAHDRQPVACPKCGSTNVRQRFTVFFPITSKKSA
jgi:putative FmdB family regulatory protein